MTTYYQRSEYYLQSNGDPIAGATVTVRDAPNDLAAIYADSGGASPITGSVVTTDANGLYSYWATAGTYTETLIKYGYSTAYATVQLGDAGGGLLVTATGTTEPRSLEDRAADELSVLDAGADPTGVDDSAAAFEAIVEAARSGTTIRVPNGVYNLSTNPWDYTKPLRWEFDNGTTFTGAGTNQGNGGDVGEYFGRLYTNPWALASGPMRYYDLSSVRCPPHSVVTAEALELAPDNGAGYPKTFTGTVTNGSDEITNVSSTTGLFVGQRITSALGGWPSDTTPPYFNIPVIAEISGNTIRMEVNTGDPLDPIDPYVWSGSTTTGVTFQAPYFMLQCLSYRGATTGTSGSLDAFTGVDNIVLNVPAGGNDGQGLEIDINNWNTSAEPRGILLTGGGANSATCGNAIDIQRGYMRWRYALAAYHCLYGIYLNAKQGAIQIDTAYTAASGDTASTFFRGIHFLNAPDEYNSLFNGRQLANGGYGIRVWRYTDTSPTGRAFQLMDAANSTEPFYVDVSGAIYTYAPATSGGNTTLSGSIYAGGGLKLGPGTRIHYGQNAVSGSLTPAHYIEMYAENGDLLRIPCYKV